MIIPDAFGPFFVGENFIANNPPSLVTIDQQTMATPSSPINNPTIPFHPPPINGLNNPQIIFHTPPCAMANNTLISPGAPSINTIQHAPIINPYNPPSSFFCGCPLNPHQVAHGHMVSPSYSLGPESDPVEQDNWTMGCTVDHPPISFHPPVIAPYNPPLSYFSGYHFYPPSAHEQFVASNYWPGPAGSAPCDSIYFEADPRHHYFTRSSSSCSSTEPNETPTDDLVEEDERSMVDEPIVRVNSPVEIEHKGDKLHGMDVASLSVIIHLLVSLLNDCM